MKKDRYHIIFRVSVSHTYFENENCRCVYFKPKSKTTTLLTKYSFIFRNTINGFELHSHATNDSDLLKYISRSTGIETLDFDLFTDHDAFNYFTDLPANWIGQLNYDTRNSQNLYEKNSLILVPDLIPGNNQNTIGTLLVCFDDLMKKQLAAEVADYRISYTARATPWQYFIINRSAIKLDRPGIIGKSEVKFTGPEAVHVETGEKALLFSSYPTLIPLHINPKHKFDLVDGIIPLESKSLKIKTIIKGLPTPKAGRLGFVKNSDQLLSSSMYIYL
ncbi:hypothetical protein G6M26_20990 [Agrobacterium tumefaciens]|nr:hypothetical protein [Agrobacterium tumefaciens]NTE21015.1 hypothetical protein [Agrobacterium tumefaciens]